MSPLPGTNVPTKPRETNTSGKRGSIAAWLADEQVWFPGVGTRQAGRYITGAAEAFHRPGSKPEFSARDS